MSKVNKMAVIVIAVMVGVVIGRLSKPPSAKAAAASRIVHIQVNDSSAAIPGWGLGTATGISCIRGEDGADCYVVLQGN